MLNIRGDTETEITFLPAGFKIIEQKSRMASVDLFCIDCDTSAVK